VRDVVTLSPADPPLRRAADAEAGILARRFEEVLRVGDGRAAEQVMDDALASGMAPEAIQSLVITPAMVRIGELWELRVLGVADEHLATSISQHALVRLFETMSVGRDRSGSREDVLLAAVEGQHHVLGLRMVADVLEGAGYQVRYLGEDVPVASLRAFALQHRPAVVGLSFGITSDVSTLADSLWALHEVSPDSRILLGGRAVPPALQAAYRYVPSSMDVRTAIEEVLAAPPQPPPPVLAMLRSDGSFPSCSSDHEGETDTVAERMSKAAEHAVHLAREHFRRSQTYRDLAFRDPLTDLANRRAFEDALVSATATPGEAAVLMIDVDKFKTVNDTQGHDAGDSLLRAIAQAISGAVRPGDVAARVGGDEFAILLPATPLATACEVGERIRATVADSSALPVSLSIGVAPLATDSRVALIAADTALYKAKAAGRNRVVAVEEPVPLE
jgi:diguanylate cyclase (GGDEF)-like protein